MNLRWSMGTTRRQKEVLARSVFARRKHFFWHLRNRHFRKHENLFLQMPSDKMHFEYLSKANSCTAQTVIPKKHDDRNATFHVNHH